MSTKVIMRRTLLGSVTSVRENHRLRKVHVHWSSTARSVDVVLESSRNHISPSVEV